MTNRGIDIKNPKQRGEWAEMCFTARAAEHGLRVTKPYGDSAHYDFAVEHRGHFLRVQVKSTKRRRKGAYICNVICGGKPYKAGQIDLVAAYAIPEDIWYLIPAHAVRGRYYINLAPHVEKSKYWRYQGDWGRLRVKTAKSRGASAGR